jgi:hypothetical protein
METLSMYPAFNTYAYNNINNNYEENVYESNNHPPGVPPLNDTLRKPRRVTFFKNGDRYFGGKTVTIRPNKYFSFKELMNDLNRNVDLPYGVRRVYTPVGGREIYHIDQLVDGESYVCASFEPFKQARYGEGFDKPWNSNRKFLQIDFLLFIWL